MDCEKPNIPRLYLYTARPPGSSRAATWHHCILGGVLQTLGDIWELPQRDANICRWFLGEACMHAVRSVLWLSSAVRGFAGVGFDARSVAACEVIVGFRAGLGLV